MNSQYVINAWAILHMSTNQKSVHIDIFKDHEFKA